MRILLWLAVPIAVTMLAMAVAAWRGRTRDTSAHDDQAYERFSAAVQRPLVPRSVAAREPERSSGVVVRPSRTQ